MCTTCVCSARRSALFIWCWLVLLITQMIAFILASDEPTDLSTLDDYAFRFDIEDTFLDEKSGGFQ